MAKNAPSGSRREAFTRRNSYEGVISSPPVEVDFLYHLGLDTSMDLTGFKDVKYVIMGGSASRAFRIAQRVATVLAIKIPTGLGIQPVGKTDRFSLYKVGPVISVNHGMGIPSLNILLHELAKLLVYAGATDYTFFRCGTSGGIGVPAGSVVVSNKLLNGELKPVYELAILGTKVVRDAHLPGELVEGILKADRSSIPFPVNVVSGATMSCDDFYEGQARLDGAMCDYTEEDKMAFLRRCAEAGVTNIEMEALAFGAFCNRLRIPAAVVCVTLLDRLQGDQVTVPAETLGRYDENSLEVVLNFIRLQLAAS